MKRLTFFSLELAGSDNGGGIKTGLRDFSLLGVFSSNVVIDSDRVFELQDLAQ